MGTGKGTFLLLAREKTNGKLSINPFFLFSCERIYISLRSVQIRIFCVWLKYAFFVNSKLYSRSNGTEGNSKKISACIVSSNVVMSSHLITNRMRFYFFQSKCVVNVSSACHFPTRGGMQCKIVRLSLSFPRSKFENFMGYSCFMGYP